ncbi:hypothetical protein H6F51_18800 [Cyanobacteria bacterium FACHB-DQ100]|uniref:hypothetical protein n=1 Tax=unclassified Leptolyngbya TaxID=2650499 RepID=UPI0016815108|nr:hypothetical protein [Leptolyngbya sp. FACHB-17]MBD1824520.1 hypothetical protein [Cyanobacteria bacterium FACHB-DQ100]MBD2080862.1 hypothetical protein [Leptolyngbya sp. FACHB-17]
MIADSTEIDQAAVLTTSIAEPTAVSINSHSINPTDHAESTHDKGSFSASLPLGMMKQPELAKR